MASFYAYDDPFRIDRDALDTPEAQAARFAGLLQVKRAAARRAERLATWARPLLVGVVSVSALHIFGQVARFAPATVEALQLPALAYHATAGALTLAVDLVALWLTAAGGALRLAGHRSPRVALGYTLALTFALNAAYMLAHAPTLGAEARAAVMPWLDALFVVALPLFIPVALYAVEGAAQRLEAARLALLVEAAALRPLAQAGQPATGQGEGTPPPDPAPAYAYAGPVAVYPSPSWPRVEAVPTFVQPVYPAPERVEDAPPPMRADAGQESMAPHPAPLACPRCGAELDRPRYLAARRWGRCASCKGVSDA